MSISNLIKIIIKFKKIKCSFALASKVTWWSHNNQKSNNFLIIRDHKIQWGSEIASVVDDNIFDEKFFKRKQKIKNQRPDSCETNFLPNFSIQVFFFFGAIRDHFQAWLVWKFVKLIVRRIFAIPWFYLCFNSCIKRYLVLWMRNNFLGLIFCNFNGENSILINSYDKCCLKY